MTAEEQEIAALRDKLGWMDKALAAQSERADAAEADRLGRLVVELRRGLAWERALTVRLRRRLARALRLAWIADDAPRPRGRVWSRRMAP